MYEVIFVVKQQKKSFWLYFVLNNLCLVSWFEHHTKTKNFNFTETPIIELVREGICLLYSLKYRSYYLV